MKILSSIPAQLRGRGHNECCPIECSCGCQMLFPISDGLRSDGDLDDPSTTVTVKCPVCMIAAEISVTEIVSHNGQVK